MAEPEKIILEPYYYRDNFLRLCDTVEAQYDDILDDGDHALLRRFRNLQFNAQCLYIRLTSRTGPWFRESKLLYEELGDPGPAVDELLRENMAAEPGGLSTEELSKLYTQYELLQIFAGNLGEQRFSNKTSLLNAIDTLALGDKEILQAIAAFEDARIIAPAAMERVQNLQILFFGNRRQSLTEFVLQDLGVTRYYPYTLNREHRLFSCRAALDEYLDCAALSDGHYELLEQQEQTQLPALAEEVLARVISFTSSENRWHRLCNKLARDLERLQEWDLALQLYARSQRHPARERRARILEKNSDWATAVTLCQEIIARPWCEAELEAAGRILPRVKRKLDGGRLPRRKDDFEHTQLRLPPGPGSVELKAASHLQDQWQSVHYVENGLMTALFGLAFWGQVFAPVPGVFNNPFQSAPTDMYDPAFATRRQAGITARIEELRVADLPAMLAEACERYQHYQCRWIDWRRIDAERVADAAAHIPGEHLLAIWERILFDPGENRRGFPDLIAFGTGMADYCMIEVKGPGDALQDNQKRWLRYFAEQGIPAQVAWVEWTDD